MHLFLFSGHIWQTPSFDWWIFHLGIAYLLPSSCAIIQMLFRLRSNRNWNGCHRSMIMGSKIIEHVIIKWNFYVDHKRKLNAHPRSIGWTVTSLTLESGRLDVFFYLFIKPSFEFNVLCNFNLGIVLLATCSGWQSQMVCHVVEKSGPLFMKCDLWNCGSRLCLLLFFIIEHHLWWYRCECFYDRFGLYSNL